ncbi:zinc-dependent alcohol dehydrogenase family protein [Paraburkholderia sp. C35]|uniref:zinc-dependent alcohol dehydrogenase family protein n=1 Tax=Paraburkholderia sp. C35 TaxID=2126993 RepID=UPI000D695811|nr:zinc-dependent alcohol dehydrogenase family protein [Paraburkholderia sp. C35]
MKTMKVLLAHSFGEPKDVLRIEERPLPEPGPGQVRVRVKVTPIHASDLSVLRDRYGYTAPLPAIVGLESVGTIDALGEGVDGLTVGQDVITIGIPGTWQEYLVADKTKLLPVPKGMSLSSAAQLLVNPVTAVLLTQEVKVAPGEWLVQTAAGSTVGKMVIQLGKALGFKTINIVRRRAAVDDLLALGADAVICTEDEDVSARIKEIAGENGVSKALDCVAGELGAEVSRALAPTGELLVYGALSTHRQTEPQKLVMPLSAKSLIYQTKTVRGFWLLSWIRSATPAEIQALVGKTLKLVSAGDITIPEGVPYRIDQFAEAVVAAEAPAHGAKPVFVFED